MTDGTLYALDTGVGLVKFGWTSRELWQRIADYPPTFRLMVHTAGSRADERDLHRSLAPARVARREWYAVTPEVVRTINTWIDQANDEARRACDETGEVRIAGTNRTTRVYPYLLPTFSTLEDWDRGDMPAFAPSPQSRPGPRVRSRATRI